MEFSSGSVVRRNACYKFCKGHQEDICHLYILQSCYHLLFKIGYKSF